MADYIPRPNDTLGRYQLLTSVARGGMGQVWLARLEGARGFQKLVAIKMLLNSGGDQGRFEQMMLEEARIASLIQHPNVVQTIELGEQDGTLFLVMEWVDGEALSFIASQAKQRGPIPLGVACALIAQTLRGLHAAHELCDASGAPLGVVHRDVSPQNVLVTYTGVAKLVDFGIAKATNQALSNTIAGELKGKLAHMSPEQLTTDDIDRRSDIFSAGIMLYTLTAGRHPFEGPNSGAVVHNIVSREPVLPPSSFVQGYPRKLEAVVLEALEKDPARRFQTAEAMRLALERAVADEGCAAAEPEISRFLAGAVGDSARAKREKLLAVLRTADEGRTPTGPGPTVRAESNSSLRAISLDSEPEEPAKAPRAERDEPRRSLLPRSRRARHAAVAVALGVGLALGLLASRVSLHEPSRASSATSELVALTAPASSPLALQAPKPPASAERAAAPSSAAAVGPAPSSSAKPQSAGARQEARRARRPDRAALRALISAGRARGGLHVARAPPARARARRRLAR